MKRKARSDFHFVHKASATQTSVNFSIAANLSFQLALARFFTVSSPNSSFAFSSKASSWKLLCELMTTFLTRPRHSTIKGTSGRVTHRQNGFAELRFPCSSCLGASSRFLPLIKYNRQLIATVLQTYTRRKATLNSEGKVSGLPCKTTTRLFLPFSHQCKIPFLTCWVSQSVHSKMLKQSPPKEDQTHGNGQGLRSQMTTVIIKADKDQSPQGS